MVASTNPIGKKAENVRGKEMTDLNDAWSGTNGQNDNVDNWGSNQRLKLRDIADMVVRITGLYPMATKFGDTQVLQFEDGQGLLSEAWCSAGVVVRKVQERLDKGRLPLDGVICKKAGKDQEYWDVRQPKDGDPWYSAF